MTAGTILFVAGGIESIPGVARAKEMGLHVVVSDGNTNAPAFALADDRIIADTYDVSTTVAEARSYHRSVRKIDGVICVASDVPLTVASVAADLGLPGIPIESARLASDKLAMKRKFEADGVPIPWFSPVESPDQLRRIVAERGFPLVLKPVDSRGARGVLRLRADVDMEWGFAQSHRHSPTGRVMVERFLSGPQVSTESIVLGGTAHTPGFADRNYEYLERYAPHIIENGGELPSFLSAEVQRSVRDVVGRAALSMGITDGVVKGDIVVHEGCPYVIELAARLSGGYFCSHEIPLNTGVDFVGQAIRLAVGERIDPSALLPRFQRHVAQRYFFPDPGRVVRVVRAPSADRDDVALYEIRVKVGDLVAPIDSHPARAGVVIATGESREAALNAAMRVCAETLIETSH